MAALPPETLTRRQLIIPENSGASKIFMLMAGGVVVLGLGAAATMDMWWNELGMISKYGMLPLNEEGQMVSKASIALTSTENANTRLTLLARFSPQRLGVVKYHTQLPSINDKGRTTGASRFAPGSQVSWYMEALRWEAGPSFGLTTKTLVGGAIDKIRGLDGKDNYLFSGFPIVESQFRGANIKAVGSGELVSETTYVERTK